MARRTIDGVKLGATWNSWAGSAEAALRAAKLFDGDTTELMGRTGFAFHFQINAGACPSSVTEFPWTDLPVYALDLLGVDSEAVQVAPPGMFSEPAKRARAIERIKASIDAGRPTIAWAPTPVLEFGVLHGYDDDARAFEVTAYGPPGGAPPTLRYDELGRGEVPILFYQLVLSAGPVDVAQSRRRALELAVKLWRPDDEHPGRGKLGYTVLLDALERRDFVPFGLAYNMTVYADAKRHAFAYLQRLAQSNALPGLEPARDHYARVAKRFTLMTRLIPFAGPGSKVEPSALAEVVPLVRECARLEDEARGVIQRALQAGARPPN